MPANTTVTNVLGLLLLVASVAPGGDVDRDEVADSRAPDTLVADLNMDAELDVVRFGGRTLTIASGWAHETHQFADTISGVSVGDLNADGLVELLVTLASGDRVILESGGLPRTPGAAGSGATLNLNETWNSENQLGLVWGAKSGDFDGDGRSDILTMSGSLLKVFESDGDDSFSLSFSMSPDEAPFATFTAVATGDSDLDGQQELLGITAGTLNQVFLYENEGDDTYVLRDINISAFDPSGSMTPTRIAIADTDRDGRMEIIFDTSSSDLSGSTIHIYEHVGAPGENVYTKIFEQFIIGSIFSWDIGDSDNDGDLEIVLGLITLGNFPIYLQRFENTGDNTYEHKITQPGGVGLASAPIVADVDGDGENELVFAGSPSGWAAVC